MTSFWSWYIIILTVITVFGSTWLLFAMRTTPKKKKPKQSDTDVNDDKAREGREKESKDVEEIEEITTTGHEFDGITELNTPLPRWWMWLFLATIVFSIVYSVLYPTLGNFKGVLGWTSVGEHDIDKAKAEQKYIPIFKKYFDISMFRLAKDPKARRVGERIFANHCATCHGADATGAKGFPNLTDNNWLHGGHIREIENTIFEGRINIMPGWKAALGGDEGVKDMVTYVRHLSGLPTSDPEAITRASAKFKIFCTGCHGEDGKGKTDLGAPNLTINNWLYGGSVADLTETIANGRKGVMPAQKDSLGKEKVHVVAAYVYYLANQDKYKK